MNGPQHYVEAEDLLACARELRELHDEERARDFVEEAKVHATLALAAAQVGQILGLPGVPSGEWDEVTRGSHYSDR